MKKFILIILYLFLIIPNLYSAITSQSLFDQGIEAFNSGNYITSELLLRKILDSDSDANKEQAWYYLARSKFQQKKYEDAIFEFNRFLTTCTNQELCTMSRYWIAESYYQKNDQLRSIEEFKRFISLSKDSEYIFKSYERIGMVYFSQQRYDEAIIEWMKITDKSKDKSCNSQLLLNIGEAQFLNKNYPASIDLLKPLMDAKTDSKTRSIAVLITGKSYQNQGKNKLALKTFSEIDESLIGEKPYNEVQYFRALSYIAQGNNELAEMHLKSFLSAAKDSQYIPNAKYQLAIIYLKANKTKDALDLLEYVRKNTRPDIKNSVLIELSKIYMDINPEEAVKCLLEADMKSSDYKKEILLQLSKAYIKANNLSSAENILNELLNNYAYDKEADSFHFLLGRTYLEENNYEGAITEFNKIKAVNPFSSYIQETNYYMALANIKKKQSEDAIKLLTQYTGQKNAENRYSAYVNLVNLYSEKHDFKNSDRIMEILIRNYPAEKGIEDIIYGYSATLAGNNRPNDNYINLIINKYNNTRIAGSMMLKYGDEAFSKKDFAGAEKYYRQYLSVQWRDNAASVFLYHIISLEKLGNYKEIVSIINSEEKVPPLDDYTSKQVKLWLAKAYYNTNEYKKALDSYSYWRLNDLSAGDLLIMVKCLIKLDDITSAKRMLDLLQTDNKTYIEALYELGLYYISKKDNNSAYYTLFIIIEKDPDSNFAENSRTDIAGLYIEEEKFSEAVELLDQVRSSRLEITKNSLLTIAYFRSGKDNDAIALTKKYLDRLPVSPISEKVIKENLLYYYRKNDEKNFNQYVGLLDKYSGNTTLINYLSGKLYFQNKKYNTAYKFFFRLIDSENEYKPEAIYLLGTINLLKNKNLVMAISYFKRLEDEKNPDNEFALKGKINLAILFNERKETELSKKILFDIINKSENRLFKIQAENLVEHFGYKE